MPKPFNTPRPQFSHLWKGSMTDHTSLLPGKQVNRWSLPVRHWGNKRATGQSEAWDDIGLSHLWERSIFHKAVLPNFYKVSIPVSSELRVYDKRLPAKSLVCHRNSSTEPWLCSKHRNALPASPTVCFEGQLLSDLTLQNALFAVSLSGTLVRPLKIHPRGCFPAWGGTMGVK